MRSVILTLVILFTVSSAFAQYRSQDNEIAIYYGENTTTQPIGGAYKGTKSPWSSLGGVSYHRMLSDNWQIGGDVTIARWATKGDWGPIQGPYGKNLGYKPVTYMIADPAVTVAFQANRVMPFYLDFDPSFIRSQFYYGVTVGAVFTANDGGTTTTTVKTPETFTYTSQFDFQNGKGFVVGVQAGYSFFLTEHIGLNLELAPRFYEVFCSDPRSNYVNKQYHLATFTAAAGFRIRF